MVVRVEETFQFHGNTTLWGGRQQEPYITPIPISGTASEKEVVGRVTVYVDPFSDVTYRTTRFLF